MPTVARWGLVLSLGLIATVTPAAWAQTKHELKLAYFVGDQHAMSQWLIKWSEKLEKDSGGRLTFKRFAAPQMGSVHEATRRRRPGRSARRRER